MTQEHERAAGAWHAEWKPSRDLLETVGSAASWLRDCLEHLEVDAARMRRNLDLTGGLLMAERVTTALAPALGRLAAHDLVAEASAEAGHRAPCSSVARRRHEDVELASGLRPRSPPCSMPRPTSGAPAPSSIVRLKPTTGRSGVPRDHGRRRPPRRRRSPGRPGRSCCPTRSAARSRCGTRRCPRSRSTGASCATTCAATADPRSPPVPTTSPTSAPISSPSSNASGPAARISAAFRWEGRWACGSPRTPPNASPASCSAAPHPGSSPRRRGRIARRSFAPTAPRPLPTRSSAGGSLRRSRGSTRRSWTTCAR